MKISLFKGILMGVFILGALVGLFVFATYTSKNSSTTVGPVLIWGILPKEDINATLAAINQTGTTGLKNVTYIEKDPTTIATDLSAAIATGAAPDLVLDSQENLHTLSKFIAPISLSTLPVRTFTDTFVEEGSVFLASGGAGYYGIPFLVDPLVLFANRSILSSSGVARPPSTWEALIGLVPNVARFTSTRQITRGLIALGTYSNVHSARGILSSLFLQTGVPLSANLPSGALVADLGSKTPADGGAPPGRAVLGFYTQFADPSKVSYTWNVSLPDSERMFLSGDLALYLGYASRARFLQQANPNLNFDIAPLPQPATATTRAVYGLVYALMIPRGAKNAAGAYQAAVLLTNAAEQAAAAAHTGLAPAVLSQLAIVPADPIAAVTYAEALYSKGWLSPSPSDTDVVFSGMISNVITGRSSLSAALISAEQSFSALLRQ